RCTNRRRRGKALPAGARPETARRRVASSFEGRAKPTVLPMTRRSAAATMFHSVRRPILVATILALACAPAAAAATPTILVKFKEPAGAATRIQALGDDPVGQTANRVSIVRLAPGKSAAARIAAYDKRAD